MKSEVFWSICLCFSVMKVIFHTLYLIVNLADSQVKSLFRIIICWYVYQCLCKMFRGLKNKQFVGYNSTSIIQTIKE